MELTNRQLFNRLSTETLRQIRRESWDRLSTETLRQIRIVNEVIGERTLPEDNALNETMKVLDSVLLSRR